jgi:ABC-type sugar transport system permease subunit
MRGQNDIFKRRYQNKWFTFFVLPSLIVYTLFWGFPIISTLALSFTNWSGINALTEAKFIGFKNYREMSIDPIFMTSLKNNLNYGVVMIAFVTPLSFFIAYILDAHTPGKKLFGTFVYLPAILPVIVVVMLWRWILNPQYGLVNNFLETIGLKSLAKGWLSDTDTALGVVCFVSIWKSVPVYVILCLAGLQQVPQQLREAAIIDGANERIVVFHIVIPSMQRVLNTIFSLVVIDIFRIFELVYVMTNGGPGYYSTEMLLTYMYKTSFANSMAGYGSAIATTTIAIVLVITAINLRLSSKSNED